MIGVNGFAQNTVGVISLDSQDAMEGYTLLYPLSQPNVYLINNCGQVVHEWSDSTAFWPGVSVYLLENGNLLKTKRRTNTLPGSITGGGSGGIIEMRTWENEMLWTKEIENSEYRAHHDVEILPNGNVLIIAWQRRSREEYIESGGDTVLFDRQEIWPDVVQEYDPVLDSIVWEWDSWDHLVQDYDENKSNYGDVASSPGKIDLNYDLGGFGGRPDWIHSNAIDYNAGLDQIILSASHFEEAWIIDHSTTKEEVKRDTGGNFGKGGQLLFRWGNPRAYKNGGIEDQKLFFQHDVQWLDNIELVDSDYYNQIGIFNNRVDGTTSAINVLKPEIDFVQKEYKMQGETFLPLAFELEIQSSEEVQFQSSNMSSMQLLSNGNFLVCSAQRGKVLEMNSDNEIVWEYILPFRNGNPVAQGTLLNLGDNVLFRAKKFSEDFPAFEGKSLDAKYNLELDPNLEFCDFSLGIDASNRHEFLLFPNPAVEKVSIVSDIKIEKVEVLNGLGTRLDEYQPINSYDFSLSVIHYSPGLYYVKLNNNVIYKLLIIR